MSDDLMARARSGDEQALRLLYEESRGRVLRLARALLADADEAEDVMQDVLVYALTHLDRYDASRGAFGTWLHTITLNRVRDRERRRRMSMRRVAEWLLSAAGGSVAEERIERLDSTALVEHGLRNLTARQREALVLREIEGLSLAELAEVLQVPLRTAQARVTSAHAAMRRALEPRYREADRG